MRDYDNPFIKILDVIEILRKEKEVFDKEQIKIINPKNKKTQKTIELFQTLALCARKSETTSISLLLVNNHLRVTSFLEEIERMVKLYKKKEKGIELMIYGCRIPEMIDKIVKMIPESGKQLTLFEPAFY